MIQSIKFFTNPPINLKDLKKALASPPKYKDLKRQCKAGVKKWIWATGPAYGLRPFEAEIGGWSRGKKLTRAPKKKEDHEEFGFDALGRLICHRRYINLPGLCYEDFFVWNDHGTVDQWSFHYSPHEKEAPWRLDRYFYEQGRVVCHAGIANNDATNMTIYQYKGDKLVHIDRCFSSRNDNRKYHLYYAEGKLATIESENSRGKRNIIYRRAMWPFPKVLASLHKHLLQAIPKAVRRAKPDEPVFCLALLYDSESYEGMTELNLALGLESERTKWHANKGKKNLEALWNAQDFRTFLDPELDIDDDRVAADEQELIYYYQHEGKGSESVRRLFIEVAKELNQRDWSKILKVTDDFVVYPMDLELADIWKNFKAAVPANKLRLLKKRGEF
jgi:hypothetical protein